MVWAAHFFAGRRGNVRTMDAGPCTSFWGSGAFSAARRGMRAAHCSSTKPKPPLWGRCTRACIRSSPGLTAERSPLRLSGAHKGVRDFGVGQSRLPAIAADRGMRGAQRKCDILTSLALDASGVFSSCARLVRQVRFARPFLWACAGRAFCLSFALRPARPGRCIIGGA